MKNKDMKEIFMDQLADMHGSENQIIKTLPKLIEKASSEDLIEALSNHLEETKNQVKRIKKMYAILHHEVQEEMCDAMKGILKEGDEMIKGIAEGPILDATIIAAAQKVEHYEIASYGTLRSFAKYLNFDDRIIELIQETLDEEGSADKTLTKIADGSIFFGGVNQAAVEEGK